MSWVCTPHSEAVNIFSDRGRKFTKKQFTWLANELGFNKVYTPPYIPMGNK